MKQLGGALTVSFLVAACGGLEGRPGVSDGISTQQSEIRNGTFTTNYSGVGLLSSPYGRCTATLLGGSQAILTAAHCVTTNAQSNGPLVAPSQLTMDFRPASRVNYAGFYDNYVGGNAVGTQILRQGLLPGGYFSDVAIVRLDRVPTITVNRYRTDGVYLGSYPANPLPVKIAAYFMDPVPPMNILGYGVTSNSTDPTIRREGYVYPRFSYHGFGYPYLFDVGPTGANQSACPGDSGGPAIVSSQIWGVLSSGITSGGTVYQQCANVSTTFYSYAMYFGPWARSIDSRF